MPSGQSSTTSGTSVADKTPWSPAIPALTAGLTDATNLYNSGVGSQIYQGPRNAGLTTDQTAGIESTRDQAAADNSGAIGTSWLQGTLAANGINPLTTQGLGLLSGLTGTTGITAPGSVLAGAGLDANGLTAGQNGAIGTLLRIPGIAGSLGLDANGLSQGTNAALGLLNNVQGVGTADLQGLAARIRDPNSAVNQTATALMNGSRDITTQPALTDLYNRALAPSSAEQNLSATAAGANLDPTTNPIFQRLAQTSADNAEQAQKQAFAASGRYGSGSFAGAVAKAVNDTQSQLYAGQYNTERAAQAAAAGQIDAARQAGTQLGAGIQGQIGQVQQQNNTQRLSGASLAQAQDAAESGVLGQVQAGQQFNSNLDLSKANTALNTYGQGTANNIGIRQFDTNLALSQATGALGAYGQGAAARLQGATTDAANNLAAQQANAGTQQFNTNLGLQQAQGYIGAGQQGTGAALQGAGLLPAVDALRYAPAGNLLQVGGLQQQQNQADINAAQSYFQDTQSIPWQALSQYLAFPTAIGSMGGTQVTNSTQRTQTSGPSLGQTLLGGGLGLLSLGTGGGATLGGTFLKGFLPTSDVRAKENIERVGRLEDGQPIYRYTFKGDDTPQIGLLAQEVLQRNPDAVGHSRDVPGLLGVDYGKATDEAAHIAALQGKKGDDGSSGGSAPAAPPAGLLAGLNAPGGHPGEPDDASPDRPRVMVMIQGRQGSERQDADTSARIGAAVVSALSGGLLGHPHGDDHAAGGLLAGSLRAMIPQEPAPIRRDKPKAPASGKRRAAA